MSNIKTTLHAYSFRVTSHDEAKAYDELRARLSAIGLKCFESHGGNSHYLGGLDGATIELETTHLFDNQWNTAPIGDAKTGLRVFDWAQDYLPNRDPHLKRGHWIEQTDEMREVRAVNVKCGYCGHMEPIGQHVFCPKCMGSEYLKEADLRLRRLLPAGASFNAERPELTTDELAEQLPLYRAAQGLGAEARQADRLAKSRQKVASLVPEAEKKSASLIADARKETEAHGFLLDHGWRDLSNVIFYSHTQRFSFGWRTPLNKDEVSLLLDIISEFPFAYDLKCADGRTLSGG